MVRWEYCEVANIQGRAYILYLIEEGRGWESQEVAERNVENMAVVLARLGRKGWEVISIASESGGSSYTSSVTLSRAFLKRPLAETE